MDKKTKEINYYSSHHIFCVKKNNNMIPNYVHDKKKEDKTCFICGKQSEEGSDIYTRVSLLYPLQGGRKDREEKKSYKKQHT